MKISFSTLAKILNGEPIQVRQDYPISHIFIDSRHPIISISSIFIAIEGKRNDAHDYIFELYQQGIRNFIIEKPIRNRDLPEANILRVENSIAALQILSAAKRKVFNGNIIGITGSNGKTITKEWLSQLLSQFFSVHKSPRSYNSQVGVPLSLWGLSENQDFGIIEAGISTTTEMANLESIIKPDIGIFTNIGTAHDEGFVSMEEKADEKAQLFKDAKTIIFSKDYPEITHALYKIPGITEKELIGWSFEDNTSNYFIETEERGNKTAIRIPFEDKFYIFELAFTDYASLENITHCLLLLLHLGIPAKLIQHNLLSIRAVSMRLELKRARNDCYIIDDTYNNDLAGLETALQFLAQHKQSEKKSIILSELLETGRSTQDLHQIIIDILKSQQLYRIVLVGSSFVENKTLFEKELENVKTFQTTNELKSYLNQEEPYRESILIKGARKFHFEQIVKQLSLQIHETKLEINLNNLAHNYNFYHSLIRPGTKVMAMVKAAAYGGGLEEIANWLQYHKVDYLAVAYTDEGVLLRKKGIKTPIMVMNPSESSFENCFIYELEPEIYSLRLLRNFMAAANKRELRIHLKLDTGMHRLGFDSGDMADLIKLLKTNTNVKIASIFSHLAAADEARHNGFSARQVMKFQEFAFNLIDHINYRPLLHVLNSSGISRFPDYQYDMVRLGIGLYGLDSTNLHEAHLKSVLSLRTVISQIKSIPKGESIGYGRSQIAASDLKSATLAIGYADGLDRKLSNGVGFAYINGMKAPIIGKVCMDMCMVDVTDIDCQEGDEAILFNTTEQLKELADTLDTIPYEVLTGISERVKRVFYRE